MVYVLQLFGGVLQPSININIENEPLFYAS